LEIFLFRYFPKDMLFLSSCPQLLIITQEIRIKDLNPILTQEMNEINERFDKIVELEN